MRVPAISPVHHIAVVLLLGAGALAPIASPQAAKLAFITSTSGLGVLGNWPDAGGNSGLAAGDAICVARATAANLPQPQTFVAWLSDDSNDAYCRVHGLPGKKSNNCGQASLPTGAGPWQRTDGVPFMGAATAGSPMAPVYATLDHDEFKQPVGNLRLFTGTNADGGATSRNCGNWQASTDAHFGDTISTYPAWSQVPLAYTVCAAANRPIACLQAGAGTALPTLPHPRKQAFVTSLMVTGNLGSAAQAGGNTGVAAGDAICRSLAQTAHLRDAQSYKVYLSDGTDPATRFQNDGPWDRLDGVAFADSFAQIHDGIPLSPLNLTETGVYSATTQYVWSGVGANGAFGLNCSAWADTAGTGFAGVTNISGPHWPVPPNFAVGCNVARPLFCLADSDAIFVDGVEPY